jgi:rod shape determining protein RodA
MFVLGLLSLSLVSPVVRETQSWVRLGVLNFQPVELMKISLIVLYAYYFSREHMRIKAWSTIFISFLLVVPPILLVALQPDLGSASILAAIWFGFLLLSGLPWQRLFIIISVFLIGLVLMWSFVLKPYHKERIMNVFYPEQHALTFNYNVIQSRIAIGSAGWWGKGYGQGSQVQAGFLPEPQTDFIFAALVEEWGWILGIIIVITFLWLLFEILRVGENADQNIERFICLGTVVMLLVQFFLNIGSVIGISPVIGVPFPFLSYGGSSLVTSLLLLGIIHGISLRS